MANNVTAVAIRGAGGSSSSSSRVAVKLDASNAAPKVESRIAKLEKVNNVWGSCAGSGSDAFPRYRRQRNQELERLEKMDKDWDDKQAAEAFQALREEKMAADDEATAKRAAKRQRRKEAKKANEQVRKEAEGINSFSADGSFLEMMQKMTPEEIEAMNAEAAKKAATAAPPPGVRAVPTVTPKQMASEQNITFRDIE